MLHRLLPAVTAVLRLAALHRLLPVATEVRLQAVLRRLLLAVTVVSVLVSVLVAVPEGCTSLTALASVAALVRCTLLTVLA